LPLYILHIERDWEKDPFVCYTTRQHRHPRKVASSSWRACIITTYFFFSFFSYCLPSSSSFPSCSIPSIRALIQL
jgi:hypothetical protein